MGFVLVRVKLLFKLARALTCEFLAAADAQPELLIQTINASRKSGHLFQHAADAALKVSPALTASSRSRHLFLKATLQLLQLPSHVSPLSICVPLELRDRNGELQL